MPAYPAMAGCHASAVALCRGVLSSAAVHDGAGACPRCGSSRWVTTVSTGEAAGRTVAGIVGGASPPGARRRSPAIGSRRRSSPAPCGGTPPHDPLSYENTPAHVRFSWSLLSERYCHVKF